MRHHASLVCLLSFSLRVWAAQTDHSTAKLGNPFTTPADRENGAMFYRSHCATCHGADGRGGAQGPDLSRGRFRVAVSDEAMFRVITKGVPGTVMPATTLDGRAVWQIVTFVRGLNDQRAVTGDAARGAAVYAKFRCAGCHEKTAPDLAEAAGRLSVAELRQSIQDPNARVSPEYWRWKGVLADGTAVEGRRMNEDSFSVQILHGDGTLRSYDRAKIRQGEFVKQSPMPAYQGKLVPAEFDDLIVYLRKSAEGAAQ